MDIELRHNTIQQRLCEYLLKVLSQDVGAEIQTGDCRIDIVTRIGEKFWFYEIKTAGTARACIREALPQLLEYSYWPGAQEAERLVVVGEAALDPESERYLRGLRRRFGLPIEYGKFDMESRQLLLDLRRPAAT